MKKTINWKLATICPIAALILAGCNNEYINIIEDASTNKILIKDIKDGTQRILVFNNESEKRLCDLATYAHYGDTIVVIQDAAGYFDKYKTQKCLKVYDDNVRFDRLAISLRQEEHLFDSLRNEILREKQGNQK